jgi:CubicO group peptidase (beta-lactamase class C family)
MLERRLAIPSLSRRMTSCGLRRLARNLIMLELLGPPPALKSAAALLVISCSALQPLRVPGEEKKPPADLAAALEPIRARHRLPALAAAVVSEGRIVAAGACGVRKAGSQTKVTLADRFHLGSCTKSMTATAIARLVEKGVLGWETSIGEVFPDLAARIHADFLPVTIEELLSHRSGLGEDRAPGELLARLRRLQGPMRERRRRLVVLALAAPPAAPRGEKMLYSNLGYAIAGAMAEARAGKDWEDLLRDLLFSPLGMASAGFGPPASPGKIDHPWGHTELGPAALPVAPGPLADNPLVLGPAGTVHASIEDFARYAALHLDGARGRTRLLEAASFRKLQAPPAAGDYALGWAIHTAAGGAGRILAHDGSNTMFYASAVIAPKRDLAVVVATNLGGERAAKATAEAVKHLFAKGPLAD